MLMSARDVTWIFQVVEEGSWIRVIFFFVNKYGRKTHTFTDNESLLRPEPTTQKDYRTVVITSDSSLLSHRVSFVVLPLPVSKVRNGGK